MTNDQQMWRAGRGLFALVLPLVFTAVGCLRAPPDTGASDDGAWSESEPGAQPLVASTTSTTSSSSTSGTSSSTSGTTSSSTSSTSSTTSSSTSTDSYTWSFTGTDSWTDSWSWTSTDSDPELNAGCGQCVHVEGTQFCWDLFPQCFDSLEAPCGQYVKCTIDCGGLDNMACVNQCGVDHPQGVLQLGLLYACDFCGRCQSSCSAVRWLCDWAVEVTLVDAPP